MSDVREAADRLQSFIREHVSGQCHILSIGNSCPCLLCDVSRLAGMALEWEQEHPADDDEPVTEEWLISLLSKRASGQINQPGDVSWNVGGDVCLMRHAGDFRLKLGYESVNQKATRGDVRRLCRALGVEIKEGVDE